MDIEKLIERLRTESLYADKASLEIMDLCMEAATALSTLQAENERLRKELEYEREHANAYHEECGQWEAENEKLRAELEQKEKYYEQMVDALAATESADLAQMTACVYYKPGGLCRYGGDDPANVCVLGPCPHERTAEEVLADLARVTAERDAIEQDFRAFTKQWWEEANGFPCRFCKFENSGGCEQKAKHPDDEKPCAGRWFEWRGIKKED